MPTFFSLPLPTPPTYALRTQVRARQQRAAQLEDALVRFHANADSLTREAFRAQGSKRMLASVPMDLMTSDAVRDGVGRLERPPQRLLGFASLLMTCACCKCVGGRCVCRGGGVWE